MGLVFPLQRPLGCLALLLTLVPVGHIVEPASAAAPLCPEGSTLAPFVRLAAIELPGEVPAGATVEVVQLTLAPGEELPPETDGHTAFYVESGTLEFLMPLRGGFHLEHPLHCALASGVELVDADGWMRVEEGSTLVSDEVPIERLRNAGSDTLELVLVSLRLPGIDLATGKPIGDDLVTDRGNRDRQERQDRRNATPTP
jgi:hypothetical protein